MTHSTTTLTPDTRVPGVGAVAEQSHTDPWCDYCQTHHPKKPTRRPKPFEPDNLDGYQAKLATATAIARGHRDDYHRWLRHVRSAAGCTQPIRLAGHLHGNADTATGEIQPGPPTAGLPDGVVYKACGNRREAVCPSCAETYRADAYQLVLAGLRGGKGVTESVGSHPAVFMTLTAPGFGPVHTRRTDKNDRPLPCRPRRKPELCPHGVDLRCRRTHDENDKQLGHAFCLECYDYDHHAVWNGFASELWRRTTITANRLLKAHAAKHGDTGRVRLSFGKVAEFQRRGIAHFHVLVRFDGIDPDDREAVIAPPEWANVFELTALLRAAVEATSFHTPVLHIENHLREVLVDRPDGWPMSWGVQLDIRPVRVRSSDSLSDERVTAELDQKTKRRRILSGQAVAGYLAKYATKATETTGHLSRRLDQTTVGLYTTDTHTGRLVAACWRLGHRGLLTTTEYAKHPYARLRRWAHMLGYGGHFFTKSRRYSTTFGHLRRARIDWRRSQHRTIEHRVDDEDQALETAAELTYAGRGWLTNGDAMLANTAAALARERHRIGREETTA